MTMNENDKQAEPVAWLVTWYREGGKGNPWKDAFISKIQAEMTAKEFGGKYEPLFKHPPQPVAVDVGNLEYMGNSVSFIYQKMRAYKDGMGKVWQALRDNGIHPDGQTHAADAIRKALAHPAPAVAQEPEFKPAYMEWHNKTEWVQEKKDWPFKTLGMHRADVMKKYIEHLEALLKPFPPLPSVGDHSQGHKPMKLIIGFNQVLNRKLREVMYSVINDFIEKDDAKALFLENVTFVAEIGDTKQLQVHWDNGKIVVQANRPGSNPLPTHEKPPAPPNPPPAPAIAQGEPVAWAETDEHGEIVWGEEGCFSNDPAWIENPIPLYTEAPAAAINEQLIGELKHIAEYWNRDQNERAMADALWHIIRVADAAIAAAEAEKAKGGAA